MFELAKHLILEKDMPTKITKILIPLTLLAFATSAYAGNTKKVSINNECTNNIIVTYADNKDGKTKTVIMAPKSVQNITFGANGYIGIKWGASAGDQASFNGSHMSRDSIGFNFKMKKYKGTGPENCEVD